MVASVRIALPGFSPARYFASTRRWPSVSCASVSGGIRGDIAWIGRLFPGGAGTDQRIDEAGSLVLACEATSAATDETQRSPTVIRRISGAFRLVRVLGVTLRQAERNLQRDRSDCVRG